MPLRLSSSLLLATGLLLTTTSCSKKTEAEPVDPASGTATYQLNSRDVRSGAVVNRQVNAQAHIVTSTDAFNDNLEVYLTTTPQPAAGEETLVVTFVKPKGPPAAAYQYFGTVQYSNGPQGAGAAFIQDKATITPTKAGGFSGTFSGMRTESFSPVNQKEYYLVDGVFTNVKL